MIYKVADNIISPLGMTTEENFQAVLLGKSELRPNQSRFGLPEPFCGSLLDRARISALFENRFKQAEDFSFFEQLCILSAEAAISACGLKADDKSVVFILSSTKGNVDGLEKDLYNPECFIGSSAEKIRRFFNNPNTPIIVSNACISGVCAQIAGVRALLSGKYDYAVIIGCDILSKFIISGFQSFKALSHVPCKPYDKDRVGLNLGEAAGTIVLSTRCSDGARWHYVSSSIHNDANHISGPSRTGEGSYRVLADILEHIDKSEIAFVNAHGTATAYNDEMESIAIHRAGLEECPLNGLKGYYGHTLGAAGIIETVLSMKAVDNGIILATKGYEECGTSYTLNIDAATRTTHRTAFIKMLSGFGGSNAGIAYRKGGEL